MVFEAEQISLGRTVALKVLSMAGLMDERQLVRFRNEAKAAATLHHPNIVPVFAVGSERGVHYYAMQYIDGPSLAQVVNDLTGDAGNLAESGSRCLQTNAAEVIPAVATTRREIQAELSTIRTERRVDYHRRLATWMAQAAEAMGYAHESGILHRDIKPGNLLLDEGSRIWIADFGLARIEADVTMTMTGDLLGTLRYMSPEQALGRRVLIDQRTDIYALGMTLYELLTLRPAFDGVSREELLRQVTFEEPRSPREIDNIIAVDLETIVLKATAKEPDDRYFSADDFAADLRRYLAGQTIVARRPSTFQRFVKFANRHRVAVSVCATTLLLAMLSIILVQTISARRVRTALDDVEKKNQQLTTAIAVSEDARKAAEQSYRVAKDAVYTLYPQFRKDVIENKLSPEDEDIWVYRQNVKLNRQLLELRPDDRELRFQAAEVLWAYAAYLMNQVNDPTDVETLLAEAAELVAGVSADAMTLEELAISLNVMILKLLNQDPEQLELVEVDQAEELMDQMLARLEEQRVSSGKMDGNQYLQFLQIQHNFVMILPEGDREEKITERAVQLGRRVHAANPNNAICTFMFATVLKDASRYDVDYLTEAKEFLDKWRKGFFSFPKFDVLYASVLMLIAEEDETKNDREKEKLLRRVIELTEPTLKRQPGKREAWVNYHPACMMLGDMQLLRLEFPQAIATLDRITVGLRQILKAQPNNENYLRQLADNLRTKAVAYAAQNDRDGFQRVVAEALTVMESIAAGETAPEDSDQAKAECIGIIKKQIEERLSNATSDEAKACFQAALKWIDDEQAKMNRSDR